MLQLKTNKKNPDQSGIAGKFRPLVHDDKGFTSYERWSSIVSSLDRRQFRMI